MTAKPRFSLRPSSALGRTRLLAVTTAVAIAISAGVGVSASRAAVGSVYFDANNNAAAGETLFNGTFTGAFNVGLGRAVMPNLTTGSDNVATGADALGSDTSGSDNVADGRSALSSNTQGNRNVATGRDALVSNTIGSANVAIGRNALFSNTTGSANVALGSGAGLNLITGSNNVAIANVGRAGDAGTIRIGGANQTATFIAGISGTTLGGPTQPVVINAAGKLGTASVASQPLSAAEAEWLLATVKRQQRQIERLRREVRSDG